MFKKLISVILAISLLNVGGITSFADMAQIVVNEVFDDYALNSVPDTVKLIGVDARVVERKGSDKAAYGKLWASSMDFSIPITQTFEQMVFSFDMKTIGKVSGNILMLTSSASLFNLNSNGTISLQDGYRIGGYGNNIWKSYTAVIDFTNKTYDVYIDGKNVLNNHKFSINPTCPSDFSFSFSPIGKDDISEVFVDNIRVYSGNKILADSTFPKKAVSGEVLPFTPVSDRSVGDIVYINSYGNKAVPTPVFTKKDDTVSGWGKLEPNGLNYLHFVQTGTNDAFADIPTGVEQTTMLVFSIDIYPVSLASSKLMVRAIGNGNAWSNLITTDSTGSIVVGTTVIRSLPIAKWTTVTVVCDYAQATGNVYINGELTKENVPLHNGAVVPVKFRIGFQSTQSVAHNEVYFNRLKLYDGDKPRELDESHFMSETAFASVNDTREAAIRKLDSDIVYMTHGDFYFQDGAKHKYSETNTPSAYSDENGIVMVPSKLLAEGLGEEITFESEHGKIKANGMTMSIGSAKVEGANDLAATPAYKDGVLYLPAASFARNVFGRYAYEDVRGFVLISKENKNYSNAEDGSANLEEIDVLYRYMQYERPTGDKIYEDFMKTAYGKRPRVYIRENEIANLRKKVEGNSELKAAFAELLKKCESYLITEPTPYHIPDGLRLFASCEKVSDIITDLYVAYYLTGEEKYRERIWVEIENALNWKDWNVLKHYLDSGEIAPGVALSYDILQDFLTEEQKKWYRERLVDLYIDAAISTYEGNFHHTAINGKTTGTNWGVVLASGMLMVSLSFMDAEPSDSVFTAKCKFLAENAFQTLEYSIGQLFPDGAVSEGIGYWAYYVKHLSWAITALLNTCGTDYGLLASPGFRNAIDYELYIQTRSGIYNHSETSGEGTVFASELFRIAHFYEDYETMEVLNSYRKLLGNSLDTRSILWYEPSDIRVDLDAYSLDKYFAGQYVTTMRSSWTDADATYVGIRGGKNAMVGSHYDKGSFIFESQGVRWFTDFGKDDMNIEGGYYNEKAWTLYRKRTEGHNNLVINPTAELPGQTVNAIAEVKEFKTKNKGAIVVYDLTDVYVGEVNYYDRAFYLGENRSTLIVQDELELIKPENDIYLFLHTKGDITITDNGKAAIVEQNGQKVKVDVICDAKEWTLEARDTTPIYPEISRPGEYPRDEYSKIALVGKASGKLNISTKITPYDDGNTYEKYSFVPYTEWTIPDGELLPRPVIDGGIYVNGTPISDFVPTVKTYTVDVYLDEPVPNVTAQSSSGTIEVIPAASLDEATRVIIRSEGGATAYSVNYNKKIRINDNLVGTKPVVGLPENVVFMKYKSLTTNNEPQATNPLTNVVDNDLNTRWAGDLNGAYMEYDLGEPKDVAGLAISYMSGVQRHYYYDILISDDGINFTKVFGGESVGGTDDYEYLALGVKARYIRYVGYGNNEGAWNSITEFHLCTQK